MSGRVAYHVPVLLVPLLAGCAAVQPKPPLPTAQVEVAEDPIPVAWKDVATEADQNRLTRAEEAWRQGLTAAARFQTAIRSEGPLLEPDVALPRAMPSPGPYRCRVIKLGGRPAFAAFKPFDCYVEAEGELLTMVKAGGSQRPAGRLWADSDTRQVFLGALSVSGGAPPPYGEDTKRDVAGFLERVEAFRWRLIVPYPQGGATLDVYELIPYVIARS
jgi:hypothetical protein